MRNLLEEATKAEFYVAFPKEAAIHLKTGNREGKEVSLSRMWDLLSREDADRLYGTLSKFVHANPAASFSNMPLPEFDQRNAYVLLTNIAQNLRITIEALTKGIGVEIAVNEVLAKELNDMIDKFKHLEDDNDQVLNKFIVNVGWPKPD